MGNKTISLSSFSDHEVLYASVTDLAKRMNYPCTVTRKGKLEVSIGEGRLKFTANNPFVAS